MSKSIYMNNELENEVSSDMSYFWYSDDVVTWPSKAILYHHAKYCITDL